MTDDNDAPDDGQTEWPAQVTILPLHVSEDLVKEGLSIAIADRLAGRVRHFADLLNEMRTQGVVRRAEWEESFGRLTTEYMAALRVLDYAGAFTEDGVDDSDEIDPEDA